MKFSLIIVAALSVAALAADSKPASTPTLDEVTQNKILKAMHVRDQAQSKMATLTNQWSQLQAQQRDLQDQAKTVQGEATEANKALDTEIDAAFKAANVDKEKFTFDAEKMAFVPKVSPAPPTPSPEKK